MSTANPIPDGVRMLIPMLVCRDGASEIDFCKTTFGAVELARRAGPDGTVVHATLTIILRDLHTERTEAMEARSART